MHESGNYISLTIDAGALKYMPDSAWYEVHVYTYYMHREYSQRVQIRIAFVEQTPTVFLELSFEILLIILEFKKSIKIVKNHFYLDANIARSVNQIRITQKLIQMINLILEVDVLPVAMAMAFRMNTIFTL